MSKLTAIIMKEIKELIRDPKILFGVLLMPLILFPAMGGAIQISQESVVQAIRGARFAVYTDSQGPVTDAFINFVSAENKPILITAASLPEALKIFQEGDAKTLLYLPAKYEANVTSGLKGQIRVYGNLKNMNIAETETSNLVGNLASIYSYRFSLAMIDKLLKDSGTYGFASVVHDPVSVKYSSIIKGTVVDVAPSSIISLVMNQSIMLPMMIMIMVMFAIQMAATSVALEKEQKTLETLMTLPVGRMTILSGKLGGSIVIAVIGAVSYLVGFSFYMNSAFSMIPQSSVDLGTVDIGLKPAGYVILGVCIFVTLVSALAMAISLAVFADSVRSAQSLTGVLIVPIILPAMVLMFSDIEMLPPAVQWIMLAIPYTHSILATKGAFLGDYVIGLRSIAYISLFTLAMLYVAAKIFSTERIITSRITSFSFRKKKQMPSDE